MTFHRPAGWAAVAAGQWAAESVRGVIRDVEAVIVAVVVTTSVATGS
ncbi:hypothetical protein [Streptomyces sp. NPDC054786]